MSKCVIIEELSTWYDFIEFVNDEKYFRECIWRGHGDADWPLLPSIYREKYGESELKALKLFYLQAKGIFKDSLHLPELTFKDTEDRNMFDSDDALKWWSIAQHHGFPSPLLDWSYHAFIALYFAIYAWSNIDKEKKPSKICVWALKIPTVSDDTEEIHEQSCSDTTETLHFYGQDNYINSRIVAQGGIFTFIRSDCTRLAKAKRHDVENFYRRGIIENNTDATRLIKIIIPMRNEDELPCRYFLAQAGITMKTLFPDLYGVAEDSKFRLRNNYYATGPISYTVRDFSQEIRSD